MDEVIHAGDEIVAVITVHGRGRESGLYNPSIAPGLAELPAEQRVGPALDVLLKMFGSVPEPDETLVTDWTGDPWALGSYSYIPIGASIDDVRRLAEPVSERLLLAGEATAAAHPLTSAVPESYSTVDAAFGSGLRAASRALGTRPTRLSLGAVPTHWLA